MSSESSIPSPSGGLQFPNSPTQQAPIREQKLSYHLLRSLPLDPLTQDRLIDPEQTREAQLNESKYYRPPRLLGSGLDTRVAEYWKELFERDRKVFMRSLFESLSLVYAPDTFCEVPAARLCRVLRQMGINPRSDFMYFICDMLDWKDDNWVSLERLRELAGTQSPYTAEPVDVDTLL